MYQHSQKKVSREAELAEYLEKKYGSRRTSATPQRHQCHLTCSREISQQSYYVPFSSQYRTPKRGVRPTSTPVRHPVTDVQAAKRALDLSEWKKMKAEERKSQQECKHFHLTRTTVSSKYRQNTLASSVKKRLDKLSKSAVKTEDHTSRALFPSEGFSITPISKVRGSQSFNAFENKVDSPWRDTMSVSVESKNKHEENISKKKKQTEDSNRYLYFTFEEIKKLNRQQEYAKAKAKLQDMKDPSNEYYEAVVSSSTYWIYLARAEYLGKELLSNMSKTIAVFEEAAKHSPEPNDMLVKALKDVLAEGRAQKKQKEEEQKAKEEALKREAQKAREGEQEEQEEVAMLTDKMDSLSIKGVEQHIAFLTNVLETHQQVSQEHGEVFGSYKNLTVVVMPEDHKDKNKNMKNSSKPAASTPLRAARGPKHIASPFLSSPAVRVAKPRATPSKMGTPLRVPVASRPVQRPSAMTIDREQEQEHQPLRNIVSEEELKPKREPGLVVHKLPQLPKEVIREVIDCDALSKKTEKAAAPDSPAKASFVILTPLKVPSKQRRLLGSEVKLTPVRRSHRLQRVKKDENHEGRRMSLNSLLANADHTYVPNEFIPAKNLPGAASALVPKTKKHRNTFRIEDEDLLTPPSKHTKARKEKKLDKEQKQDAVSKQSEDQENSDSMQVTPKKTETVAIDSPLGRLDVTDKGDSVRRSARLRRIRKV